MPTARRAYGTKPAGTPERDASDEVNRLLLEYADAGGNLTHLADHVDGLSLPGIRRRLRVARSGQVLGVPGLRPPGHGDRDPARVVAAAENIRAAQAVGPEQYKLAVQAVYDRGINMKAVARELGRSSTALYTVLRS